MMKKTIKYILALALLVTANSCLDELPDNRSKLDTDENITRMLTSVYPTTHYNVVSEMSSDNVDDCGESYDIYSTVFLNQVYHWKDITQGDNDGIENIWESSYKAIASANEILKAIEEKGNPANLDPQRGEALVSRAYNHFVLVNIFCQHYKEGANDIGIPYITKPEVTVRPKYERGTVEEVYKLIAKDLEEGLPLIDDSSYGEGRPIKYHFNKKAAYAFATRFYLFYGDTKSVIKYADLVLGSNPKNMMRDWNYLAGTDDTEMRGIRFSRAEEKSNLLLLAVTSRAGLYYSNTGYGARFTYNEGVASKEATMLQGPWNGEPILGTESAWSTIPKATVRKVSRFLEWLDPISGSGWYKSVFPLFTGEETLLSRAEAYILEGNIEKAMEDISLFVSIYMVNPKPAEVPVVTVTREQINKFFDDKKKENDEEGMEYYQVDKPTPKKRLNPSFTIKDKEQENFIHCILLLRRMLLIHEGMRWFDVKRYGIEIYRREYDPSTGAITEKDFLPKDDNRRAIQIPQDVITGGLEANPR